MDSSKALFWNTFLQECQLLTEKETKQPHKWENIYHTNKQREYIFDKLFAILMCMLLTDNVVEAALIFGLWFQLVLYLGL